MGLVFGSNGLLHHLSKCGFMIYKEMEYVGLMVIIAQKAVKGEKYTAKHTKNVYTDKT
jgi:hypothetical protein